MSDPSDLVTYTGYFGAGGMAILLLTRVWKIIFSESSAIQLMKDLQDENARLRTRIEQKEAENQGLLQDKLMTQADLRSALDKIDLLTLQVQELKQELHTFKNSVRGG